MEIGAIIRMENGQIESNFAEVGKALDAKLAEYRVVHFTEDSKNIAKKELAALRASKKELLDNLSGAKKKYMAPWNNFEARAKSVIEMYDEPITLIDGQIKAFEESRKQAKREQVKDLYMEICADVAEYIPMKKIYNLKWENATCKEKDIRREMEEVSASVRQAVTAIRGMHSEKEGEALEMYRRTLSLTDAITFINNYERQKAEILRKEQERQRQEEAERIRREERERVAAEQRAQAEKEAAIRRAEEEKAAVLRQAEAEKEAAVEQAREATANDFVDSLTPELEGETKLYEYQIHLTEDAKQKLEMYLDSIGIDYEAAEVQGW